MHARWLAFLLCLALALCSVTSVVFVPTAETQGAPRRSEAELRQLLAGAWHLAISEATGRQRIDQAIERAVSEMTYMLQGVTRSQLREKTPLNRRLDFAFAADGQITTVFDQRFTYTTRPGVAQPFTLPDGASIQVTQYFRDGQLEQYVEHALGRRWSRFALSADGQTLTMAATQQGPMMPVPVHFTLEFRKRS